MARGSVRKLDGGWGFRIGLGPDPSTGRRRQVSKQGFRTKKEAENALRDVTSPMRDGIVPLRSGRELGDFLSEWLELQADRLRPTTWRSYSMGVDRLTAGLGRVKLEALTPLQVEHFYAGLLSDGGRRREGLSPKTVRNTVETLEAEFLDDHVDVVLDAQQAWREGCDDVARHIDRALVQRRDEVSGGHAGLRDAATPLSMISPPSAPSMTNESIGTTAFPLRPSIGKVVRGNALVTSILTPLGGWRLFRDHTCHRSLSDSQPTRIRGPGRSGPRECRRSDRQPGLSRRCVGLRSRRWR